MNMEVVIHQPIGTVFAALSDARSQPRWDHGLTEAYHDPDGPARLGTRITEVRRFLGRTMITQAELVEFEPNRRLVRRGGDPVLGSVIGTLTFEDTTGGTRVYWTWQLDMPGWKSLLEPVVGPIMRRQALAILANLKEMLERNGRVAAAWQMPHTTA